MNMPQQWAINLAFQAVTKHPGVLLDDEPLDGLIDEVALAIEYAVEKHQAFMKELSDALIKARPLGGSELFVKRFDRYFADPKFCGDEIDLLWKKYHEVRAELMMERRKVSISSGQ